MVSRILWCIRSVWEIKSRKLAVIFMCYLIASFCSFQGSRKVANEFAFVIHLERAFPASNPLIKRHTAISRRVVNTQLTVCDVLGMRASSKIIPTIIESIPVNVINAWNVGRYSKNDSVHANYSTFSVHGFCAEGVVTPGDVVPSSAPVPAHQRFELGDIDDGHLVLSQRDITV